MRKVIVSICTLLILVTGCGENETTKTKSHLQVDQIIRLAQQLQNVQSDTALVISRDAYERSVQEEYASGMARSSQIMGEILYKMGGLSPATKHLNNALGFYENQQMVTEQATINLLLSKIYQRLDNYSQALIFSLKAKMLFQDVNDHLGMAHVYGNIGHLYEKTQQYDSALHYQKKALNFYSMVGDTLGLAEIHDNLGSIHEDLEDYETARDHFQVALILNKSKGNLSEATVNLNNIGDTYRKREDFSNALKYTSEALQMAESAKLDYQIKSACRDLSKIYERLAEPEKALAYINRSYDLNNRIFSEEIAQEIAKTHAVYDLEQKQQRITFLESERIYHQKLVLLYSGGIIVFLLLGVFSFYQQRAKSSKQRKLLETEAVLAKAELENAHLNEEKLSTELENKQLKSDQLQHELELKSKSLTKNALHMIQKNEFLHELRSKLKEVRKGDAEAQGKKIKKLIRSIDFSFNLDDDWHEFETIFQQVHADFYEKLKTLYPNLSPAEVRLCAMVRLNLHSKDMSTIMGISQDSLRIARYRLRKKLGLNKGANLYTFILNIG